MFCILMLITSFFFSKEEFFSLTEDLTLSIETKHNQSGNVQRDLHNKSEVNLS